MQRTKKSLRPHGFDVQGIDYSPTQNTLVTAGRDKTIRWWDTRSWKVRKVIPCFELVEAVGFIGDGQLTYTAGSNGCFRIWVTDTGRELTKEQAPKAETEAFVGAVYRPELPFVICTQVDHTLAFFQPPLEAADTTQTSPLEPFRRITGTHDEIIDLRYLLPDQSLLALATNLEEIRIVSVSEPKANLNDQVSSNYFGQDVGLLKGHEDIIISLDVDWSGYWVATGAKDNTAKLWRIDPQHNSYTCYATFSGHAESVTAVALPRARPVEGSKAHTDPLSHPPQFLITASPTSFSLLHLKIGRSRFGQYKKEKSKEFFVAIAGASGPTFEGHSNSVLKVSWLKIPEDEERAKKPLLFASAGGDGLVKVWDVNSGETACTLDNHEDRVWALAVHPRTNTVVSGSADSTVTFWKDTSVETQAASTEASLKLIEQEQELQNHIYAGSYREAITLALQLNHPGRLLALFTSVIKSKNPDAGSLTGLKAVDEVLASLSDEQLFLLLLRLRDWNTNARTAPVAQRILWALVRSYPAARFSNLSVKGARGQKSLKEVMNALKVYTERHYKRLEELVDESYLLEYTLQEMDSLAPTLTSKPDLIEDADVIMA
ncbi:putative small nucleolar ribonucleoprotein complex subunit protein [Eutypa lata UCREL1]|uniref:Putative small nucleolar ribonucleoprotein complex subunit protein n=1 Tax=Eutypa lata (strain UCR-EL1) TaxID=1287681 RepID=M7SJF5_EUTLA|nr:putative small nucleolar ribonucleoprotein complex subunit protein [Eutypa lata UCREL1]